MAAEANTGPKANARSLGNNMGDLPVVVKDQLNALSYPRTWQLKVT